MKRLSFKKRLVALLVVLVLCLAQVPGSLAANYTSTTTLADAIEAANTYWNDVLGAPWNYESSSGCAAYAKFMFMHLYDHSVGLSNSKNTVSYFHVSSPAELATVITENAKMGDAVRVSACSSASDNSGSESNTHIFILYSANSNSLIRYESNISGSQVGRRSNVTYSHITKKDVSGYKVEDGSTTFANGKVLLVKIIHAKENTASGTAPEIEIPDSAVTLRNSSAAKLSDTSYKLTGQITIPSDKTVTECGVCLGTSKDPTTVAGKDSVRYSGRSVSLWYTVSSLKPGTTYYYRFYAKASGVSTTYYGPTATFTTPASATHTHDYDSLGVCTVCGSSFPLSVTSLSQQMKVTLVNDSGKAPSHVTPYGASDVVTNYSMGSTVTVKGKASNSYGNTWYKLSDGSWIYSNYLTVVDTTPTPTPTPTPAATPKFTVTTTGADGITSSGATVRGSCTVPSGTTIKKAGVRLGTSASSLTAAAWDTGLSYTNRTFSIWFELPKELDISYTLKAGTTYYYQIYAVDSNGVTSAGAVKSFTLPAAHTHSYNTVGVCTSCGASYPLSITSLNQKMTVCAVNGSGTAPSHSTPYGDAPIGTRYYMDDVVTVVGKAANSYGTLWYKLSDGSWITGSYLSSHLHTFVGAGKCSSCGKTYTLHLTDLKRMGTVTSVNSSGTAPSHIGPYADATVMTRYTKGMTVTIIHQAYNAYGNLWYQLDTGAWLVASYVTLK